MTVAETILAQFGGRHRLTIMTGAIDYVTNGNDLTFRLPTGFARDGINCVRIVVVNDLYNLEFLKVRGALVKTVATSSGVDVEQLRGTFTRYTDLDVSLGAGCEK